MRLNIFGIYRKKVNFLFIISLRGIKLFSSHFSIILLCSARLVGIILGVTIVCTLKMVYIGDIYFFEVNTKYISSNVFKISVISRVRSTSEIADIFNT